MAASIDEGPLPPRFAGARTGSALPEPPQRIELTFKVDDRFCALIERLVTPAAIKGSGGASWPAVVETINAVLRRDFDALSPASREELYALLGATYVDRPAAQDPDHPNVFNGAACCEQGPEPHVCQVDGEHVVSEDEPHRCPCGFEWR